MHASESGISMHITGGCLVVPVQAELFDETMDLLQAEVLNRIKETGVKGLIIDFSAADIIDTVIAQKVCDTVKMAALLGTVGVVSGIKPQIASALTDLDFGFTGIQNCLNVEMGQKILAPFLDYGNKARYHDG